MRNQGTSINARIFNKTLSDLSFPMYNMSENHSVLRGSDSNLFQRQIGQNDIVCGRSYCGSEEQPTWQFCFGGK